MICEHAVVCVCVCLCVCVCDGKPCHQDMHEALCSSCTFSEYRKRGVDCAQVSSSGGWVLECRQPHLPVAPVSRVGQLTFELHSAALVVWLTYIDQLSLGCL